MAYNHEYPYTDPERYNSDWILNKVKELEARIVGIQDEIFARAKDYIDEQLLPYQQQIEELKADVNRFKLDVQTAISDFTASITERQAEFEALINAQVALFNSRIDALHNELINSIAAVNARTDLAIAQNNDYIFDVLAPYIFSQVKVLNFFTGERVSVQAMFDYLANLHVDDGINYTTLAARAKTYTQFAALDITYTDLVLHGNTLVV